MRTVLYGTTGKWLNERVEITGTGIAGWRWGGFGGNVLFHYCFTVAKQIVLGPDSERLDAFLYHGKDREYTTKWGNPFIPDKAIAHKLSFVKKLVETNYSEGLAMHWRV